MRVRKTSYLAISATLALLVPTLNANAQGTLLTVEANGAAPVGAPQSDRFGVGGTAAVAFYGGVAPWLLIGARARGGVLSNGPAPADADVADPGTGSFETLSALLRVRPFARGAAARNSRGLFVDVGGGAA